MFDIKRRGIRSPLATPKVHYCKQICIGTFPCGLPPATLTLPGSNTLLSTIKKDSLEGKSFLIGGERGIRTLAGDFAPLTR